MIIRWSFFSIICASRTTLFAPPRRAASASCSFSKLLHLPEVGAATDSGKRVAHRATGAQRYEAYAIAKIAGIKLCQAYAREYGAKFISVMPTNL